MEENKKRIIVMVVTVMALVAIVLGATYAYFQAQLGNGAKTNVDVLTDTTDSLVFNIEKDISITANQTNFAEGKGNISDSTTATAKLVAGTNNKAVYLYNIYLDILENEFKYTRDDLKPELILKITDPEGNNVTSIEGLTYNSTLDGFDITIQNGLITLVENYVITTEKSIEHNWQVEIVFENLDSDQTANAGKKINAKLKMQRFKEERLEPNPDVTLADSCQNGNNLANCIKTYADNNAYEVTNIIKHDGLNNLDANDGSYRYSGGGDLLNNNLIGSIEVPSSSTTIITYENVTFYYSPNDNLTVKSLDPLISWLTKIQTGDHESITTEEQEAYAAVENGDIVGSNKEGAYIVVSKEYLTNLGIDETAVNDYTLDEIKTILSESKQSEIPSSDVKTVRIDRKYFYKSNQTNEEMTKYAEIKIKEQLYGAEMLNSAENKYIESIENKGTIYSSLSEITTDANSKNLEAYILKIKNYVCFGADEATCPNDDLYRIIGVFEDQVKLIKADYATTDQLGTDGDYKGSYIYGTSNYKGHVEASKLGGYYYNYNGLPNHTGNNQYGSNNWETSLLNKTNLNTNYINYLNRQNPKWANMIADTKWNIGGHTTNSTPAKTFYNAEITKQTSEASKIGLMNVSDYGYATLPSNWSTNLFDYNSATIRDNNWMYMRLSEWTITPRSSGSNNAFNVYNNGSLHSNNGASSGFEGRPVLYLKADVTYVSGEGTSSNPFRIK